VSDRENGLPLEQFIQALTSQLDRAQNTMALKARAGLPLTFAVKDLTLDLRTHVEMVNSVVRIRPAGPGEPDASTLHLALTTITRPMIEENTFSQAGSADEPTIKEALGKEITDEEQRRLEWAGIHTVGQLRSVQRQGGENAIERVAEIPVNRLRAALARASEPLISHVLPNPMPDGDTNGGMVLRIHGQNLIQDGHPQVRIDGERIPVLRATHRELLVAALPHHTQGVLTVETAPGTVAQREFRLPSAAAVEPPEESKP